jgi:hypothetical protein
LKHGRRLALLPAALVVLASLSACGSPKVAAFHCLAGDRPVTVVADGAPVPYSPNTGGRAGTSFDARGVTLTSGAAATYAMKIDRDRTVSHDCWVGGTFRTDLHPESTPWDRWHNENAVTIQQPNFSLIGAKFYNVGDAISLNYDAQDWLLNGVRVEAGVPGARGGYVHDDCIENDRMVSGTVRHSKFDGCNVFMSSKGMEGNGAGQVVEVGHTIVRLQAFQNSFSTEKYGPNRHGGFFKWATQSAGDSDGTPPKLYVHDSMFRADTQGAYSGNVNGFNALPPGTKCNNVTLVAKGGWGSDPNNPTHPGWKARDIASWKSQCTNLKFGDEHDWDARVDRWDDINPPM